LVLDYRINASIGSAGYHNALSMWARLPATDFVHISCFSVFSSIRDRGIGIPVGQQAHIFGRFVRAENARASEIMGTGLGLFLSRELVERHGGHLWFESTEGAGSTFFVALPMD
jgi:signal transduction histidine kinase